MRLPSIPFLAAALVGVLKRFPFVMLMAAIGTAAMMLLIEEVPNSGDEFYIQLAMACSLGLSTMLCAALVAEKWQLQLPMALVTHMLGLALVVVYYVTLPEKIEDAEGFRFVGLNLAAHLGVAFVPYLDRSPVSDFWEYNKRIFGNFIVGAFYSLVLFGGLAVAILAVNELFNLDIDGRIYGHLFVLIAGVFNTAYFLANFPKDFALSTEAVVSQEVTTTNPSYATAFKNLTKFILIPIVAVYFLILYAFSAKILVLWELPEGWVGKLVLGFSVAGILTYLLNYQLPRFDSNVLVSGYRRWFFPILSPMLVLLFVAIGRRISDYGVTEPRYIVATAGVWLFLICLYFLASKKDNIKFIPISLAFFSVFAVLGPLSAFKASERSQTNRLIAVLSKNGLLQDGKLVAATDTLSQADAETIRSTIDYLGDNGHFGKVAALFGLPEGTDGVTWEQRDSIKAKIGIDRLNLAGASCTIGVDYLPSKSLNISGYDELYDAYLNKTDERYLDGFSIIDDNNKIYFSDDDVLLDSFDLAPFLAMIDTMSLCGDAYTNVSASRLPPFQVTGSTYDALLATNGMSLHKMNVGLVLKEWNGKVLLRKKKSR